MVVNGCECLLLERRRASIVHENRVECRCVPRRWNPAKDGHVRRATVIRHRDPGRQWDGGTKSRVRLDAGRADAVLVERVVDQKGVTRVRLFDDPLHVLQRERSRLPAMAGLAGTPIAAERLLIEELLAVELDAKLILDVRL